MGKRITVKEKIKKYTSLKEKNFLSFLKKVLGLEKKEYSDLEKNIRLKNLKTFNKLLNTSYWISFNQIGMADIFVIKEIVNRKESTKKKVLLKRKNQLEFNFSI